MIEKYQGDDDEIKKYVRKKTIQSFAIFFALIILAIAGWRLLLSQPKDDSVLKPLRKGMEVNEGIFSGIFNSDYLATAYPKSSVVKKVRINGTLGMETENDTANWMIKVVDKNLSGDTLLIPLSELKKLPKTEVIYNFKCIEGWNQITWWGGVRVSDFMKKYNLGSSDSESQSDYKYIGLSTPDGKYYVGIDMESALQPQTILCYEMNGKPLPTANGAPLRLIIPVKYGIKNLKRISTITFSNQRPPDYWAERGYDYYSGL